MYKYQFFTKPDDTAKFTYLDMDSDTFFIEKEQLLNCHFEVDGDPILAHCAEDAVKDYRFGLAGTVDEYSKSSPMHIVSQLLIDRYATLSRKK